LDVWKPSLASVPANLTHMSETRGAGPRRRRSARRRHRQHLERVGSVRQAGQANYAAAKAGIAALTIVLARELERLGVRVNAIAPVARTRLTETVASSAMAPDESGFDRFDPGNVAAVACWLASDLEAGVSGQVVMVQGGQLQLFQGSRPPTEVRSDEPWTLGAVAAWRDAILGPSGGSVPPFLPTAPAAQA
jgi:NAD(P)-dependent dehydrogenase (short-subunit alcohol dehydrogenase family)